MQAGRIGLDQEHPHQGSRSGEAERAAKSGRHLNASKYLKNNVISKDINLKRIHVNMVKINIV